jgi:hypothetical protein
MGEALSRQLHRLKSKRLRSIARAAHLGAMDLRSARSRFLPSAFSGKSVRLTTNEWIHPGEKRLLIMA